MPEIKNVEKKSLTIPGHNANNELLFNLLIEYTTQGNLGDVAVQPLEIQSVKFLTDGDMTQQKQAACLQAALNALAIAGTQSQEYLSRCQMFNKFTNEALDGMRKWEQYANDMSNKINALIEQGAITQEQFDNALNAKNKEI